jgi:hypothetical protein
MKSGHCHEGGRQLLSRPGMTGTFRRTPIMLFQDCNTLETKKTQSADIILGVDDQSTPI